MGKNQRPSSPVISTINSSIPEIIISKKFCPLVGTISILRVASTAKMISKRIANQE